MWGRGRLRGGVALGGRLNEGGVGRTRTGDRRPFKKAQEPCDHFLPLSHHHLQHTQPSLVIMTASFQSLPPEIVLHILEFLGPSNDWQSELDPTRRSPGSTTSLAPLLATSLVDRRLGQLSQQVLFRSVHLRYHSQSYRWRETAAWAYTQAVRVSFCGRGTGDRFDSHPGSLPLSSLFGLSEVHEATGRKVGIKSLWVESCCTLDFKEGLAGTGMLQGEWRWCRMTDRRVLQVRR